MWPGVYIVDGNARRAHDVAVGLLRGVAHNHQIRLEGDDGFNIEVGIVRHLQLLALAARSSGQSTTLLVGMATMGTPIS